MKQPFCRSWLCPEEFSDQRTLALVRNSAKGSAHSLSELQRALQLNSASAYRWADLGEAELNLNHKDQASYCFERALAAGPGNPAILLRAANFNFAIKNERASLRNLEAILRNPELGDYYQRAFLTYSRMDVSLDEILQGLPKAAPAAEAFLDFWIKDNREAQAARTWGWMTANGVATDKSAANYVSFLIRGKHADIAAEQWQKFNGKTNSSYRESNWVFNGSFESDPKPGPFDWHIESTHDLEASREEDTAFDGQNALRLVFAGRENVNYPQVFQETVLSPGMWKLRAVLKLDGVSANHGVALHVSDADQPKRLDIDTEPLTGTSGWVPVEKTFLVDSGTKLVRLEVVRRILQTNEGTVSGTAWIDGVELTPVR